MRVEKLIYTRPEKSDSTVHAARSPFRILNAQLG